MLKRLLSAFAATLLISGCASYKLGSSSAALDYATIFVAPPRNQSTIPQLEDPLNIAIREGVGRARKFEVTVDSLLSLRSLKEPDTYYFRDRALTVTVDVFTDSGQVSAERQAAVEIARKIAVDATELIQEVW